MKKGIFSLLAFVMIMSLAACGGSSGGATTCGYTDPADPTYSDLTGDWTYTETSITSDCEGESLVTTTLDITQDGNDIVAIDTGTPANVLTGQVSASTIKWGGSFLRGDGTVTISCGEWVTLSSATAATFTNSAFTYNETGYSCSGTISGTLAKD